MTKKYLFEACAIKIATVESPLLPPQKIHPGDLTSKKKNPPELKAADVQKIPEVPPPNHF